ncbi:PAS domain S-box-containing protein [Flavobacterium sp. 28A]|uniref:sensor histidine kinase n=1 Tax=Flavobacterium sp. 28A TaxID=2735895 RepID=UPI00156F8462|nr:PAS domain-containing sensor histidine kinase [Flavobacterium sp. 28A]NRT15755.1 PAS domain S-box-containing protein [Flavobacterium sp. 28A]
MKNKSNQIALIYLLIAMFAAIVFHKISLRYLYSSNYQLYNFTKDIFLVFFTAISLRFVLSKNDGRNGSYYNRLQKINEEIKESKEKYDIVAKATSDTIRDWKIQDDNLIWSKGLETIFGYNENQVGKTSKWWFDNIHPEDSIKMSIKLYSFLEEKTDKWQDEYRFKCADNTYKYVLDRGFILKDQKGKPVRMISAIQDITKQKEEELRLRLLETVILQTKDSIVITEADFNSNQLPKIVYVNPAFTKMTGYESQNIIGQSPDIFNGENTDPKIIKKIISSIKKREENVLEILCYKKNKESFWLRFTMIPIHSYENEVSHWVSIQRDVTEEKRQEREKEHLIRELTQTNKDLKQFSYITSHNLRAPLSNLIGLLNLVDDIEIQDTELKEILNGLDKSTHLLNDTINDLTKIMVIKDSPSIQKESVSLNEVFQNVSNQITFQIEKYKPLINTDFNKAPNLLINKSYIESILLNLLTNSIKYRSPDKTLEISMTSHRIDNNVILTFKDNGIGIDLIRNKEKIFGLYQRFHDHPESKGLGLYLVKSQVEAMGGNITIESQVNKGTTFVITFKL